MTFSSIAHEFIDSFSSLLVAATCLYLYRCRVVTFKPKMRVILPILTVWFIADATIDAVIGAHLLVAVPFDPLLQLTETICVVALAFGLIWWVISNTLGKAASIEALQAQVEEGQQEVSAALKEGEMLRQKVLESSKALVSAGGEIRRLEDLVKVSRDAIIGINEDGTVWYANPSAESLFGWAPGAIVGRSISTVVVADSGNLLNEIKRLNTHPSRGDQSEVRATCAAGIVHPLWISVSRLSQDALGGTGWVLAARDLTEKKHVEEKITQSLFEKDLLLKEVHHRVKNNLQLICSLLRLQSKETIDLTALTMFRKSEERIRSLALVHEKLYRSGSLSRIPFGSYLQDLAHQLSRSCATVASSVRVDSSVEDIEFPIDSAITCGLIANELMTNSLRHGAIQGQELVLGIRLQLRSGRVVLTLTDNGRGSLTAEHMKTATSLGLSLVRTLTAQLHGETSLEASGGLNLTLSFPDTILKVREPLPMQKVA